MDRANIVGDPPAALMRSREGMLRWTGLWGSRRLQHGSLVNRVAVSPDGTWIASACWDGTVKLWESRTGREIRTLDMGRVVLRKDRLYVGCANRTVCVYEWKPTAG